MANLLAFDTATERLHIGLAVGDDMWTLDAEGAARASSSLIPSVRHLLNGAGIGLRDLDAVAFGRGPGAFTGLRTACAVAQGLAFGAHKPVLAIDTLLAVAEDARDRAGVSDVWVAMDARMGEIYAAHYCRIGSAWQNSVPPTLYTLQALHARWRIRAPVSIAGSAPAAFGTQLNPGAALVVTASGPGARALLACARFGWEQGMAVEATMALPLYLRDRVALTIAEREAGQALGLAR